MSKKSPTAFGLLRRIKTEHMRTLRHYAATMDFFRRHPPQNGDRSNASARFQKTLALLKALEEYLAPHVTVERLKRRKVIK